MHYIDSSSNEERKFFVMINLRNKIPLLLIYYYQAIGLMSKMFTNSPGDWGSIPD